MAYIQNLLVAFIFSFIGSIPPGSINLSVIQLSLNHQFREAIKFAIAAALIEFVYAAIAIKFEDLITSTPMLEDNFHLLSAIVMMVLGVIYLFASRRSSAAETNDSESPAIEVAEKKNGFRKGTIISILNPLAIPFWIAVTAYLKGVGWINLKSVDIWTYIIGISLGTLVLLIVLAVYASKATQFIKKDSQWIKRAPGFILFVLGCYSLLIYLL